MRTNPVGNRGATAGTGLSLRTDMAATTAAMQRDLFTRLDQTIGRAVTGAFEDGRGLWPVDTGFSRSMLSITRVDRFHYRIRGGALYTNMVRIDGERAYLKLLRAPVGKAMHDAAKRSNPMGSRR